MKHSARQDRFHDKVESVLINLGVLPEKRAILTKELTVDHVHPCQNVGGRVRNHVFHIHADMRTFILVCNPLLVSYLHLRRTKRVNECCEFHINCRNDIVLHSLLVWFVVGTTDCSNKVRTSNQKQWEMDWNPTESACDTYTHTQ